MRLRQEVFFTLFVLLLVVMIWQDKYELAQTLLLWAILLELRTASKATQ